MGKQPSYAVIKIQGQQYRVSEGDEILVDKIDGKKPEYEVLLTKKNDKTDVGRPALKKDKVKIKVIDEAVKGEKMHIRTYKAKSRYRRKKGFRPLYTKLRIEKIS
jgi:large subunit ribosomal protein L21